MISQTQNRSVLSILKEERFEAMRRLVCREDDQWVAAAEASLNKKPTKTMACIQQAQILQQAREALARENTLSMSISNAFQVETNKAFELPAPLAYDPYRMRVCVDDRVIQGYNDASTFAEVIVAMGCEKVAALGLRLNSHPLVAREFQRHSHQRYFMQKIRCGEWIVITHCNTAKKKALLRQIGTRLRIDMIIQPA